MAQWLRFIIFAVIIFSFVRRIMNATKQAKIPTNRIRQPQGRKNDFRDVPPPPENPELG
jgi:hypothetical protein